MKGLERIDTDDNGHYYLYDGNRVPSVSEVLELNDVLLKNAFYEERKEQAALRGSDVHMATADLDRGMKTRWWEEEVSIGPYVTAWQQFKQDFQVSITEIETPRYSVVFCYAGTPDRYGFIRLKGDIHPATIEIKCTSVIGPHVPIQLGGYQLFCDDYEERIPVAVQLKPNGKYAAHWYDKERGYYHQIFLSALTMALWKNKNHKLGLYK